MNVNKQLKYAINKTQELINQTRAEVALISHQLIQKKAFLDGLIRARDITQDEPLEILDGVIDDGSRATAKQE